MVELVASAEFEQWIGKLRDATAIGRIYQRLAKVAAGNPGDIKPVGSGVSELRIPYGPGYRVYILQRGAMLIVLLCGGDKSTQRADIARAKEIANDWR